MEKENRVIISVLISEADKNKLQKYAKENNTTTSRIINSLIQKFITEKEL